MGVMKEKKTSDREKRRPHRGSGQPANWGAIDAYAIRMAVDKAARGGGALRFGLTRDLGAYAIGIYGLGEPYTEYLRPDQDVKAFLMEIASAFAPDQAEGQPGDPREGQEGT